MAGVDVLEQAGPGRGPPEPLACRRRQAVIAVTEPTASVTAQTAMAVFHTAFERWVAAEAETDLGACARESLDALRAVTAPAPVAG